MLAWERTCLREKTGATAYLGEVGSTGSWATEGTTGSTPRREAKTSLMVGWGTTSCQVEVVRMTKSSVELAMIASKAALEAKTFCGEITARICSTAAKASTMSPPLPSPASTVR